jgi:hypothetical protein
MPGITAGPTAGLARANPISSDRDGPCEIGTDQSRPTPASQLRWDQNQVGVPSDYSVSMGCSRRALTRFPRSGARDIASHGLFWRAVQGGASRRRAVHELLIQMIDLGRLTRGYARAPMAFSWRSVGCRRWPLTMDRVGKERAGAECAASKENAIAAITANTHRNDPRA